MNSPQETTGFGQAHEVLLDAIREQHPEWVDADGNCPACENYQHKLVEIQEHFACSYRPESP